MILLDTHVLVWMVSDPGRLSRTADREIRKAQRDRSCAIASASRLSPPRMNHFSETNRSSGWSDG